MTTSVLASRVMQWPASDARLVPRLMSRRPPSAGGRRDRRRSNSRDANKRAHWKDQHDERVWRDEESKDTRSWGLVLIMGIPKWDGPTGRLNGGEVANLLHPILACGAPASVRQALQQASV
ncbi:hypothetical protein Purlil1_13672 [Purpureocillium lilacinum]|uniref:Uncharacterized protein n=1 Tax=Purpureocillium lilacinum TaxID=33203 RepID=A0ABR0BDE6_PURLI|nr:hypothetical protein Purlil1_13672 [Purpureocillium lilacinum]